MVTQSILQLRKLLVVHLGRVLRHELVQVLELVSVAPNDLRLGRGGDLWFVQLLRVHGRLEAIQALLQLLLSLLRSSLAQVMLCGSVAEAMGSWHVGVPASVGECGRLPDRVHVGSGSGSGPTLHAASPYKDMPLRGRMLKFDRVCRHDVA